MDRQRAFKSYLVGGRGHSYKTQNAWTFTLNTESTYDREGNQWSVPIKVSVANRRVRQAAGELPGWRAILGGVCRGRPGGLGPPDLDYVSVSEAP